MLLSAGANYYCSDDHEFWNNAPNFGVVGFANTLTPGQRSWWFEEGRKLFRVFQSPASMQGFEVGEGPQNISVKVVDTRIDRYPSWVRFMLHENLQELKSWIAGLGGPGVLVLGQPLLESEGRPKLADRITSVFDKSLSYYGQYAELVESVKESNHSIVVLTGDVHFGRIAHGGRNADGTTGFIEVISSPMCHVTGASNSGYKPARTPDGWAPLSSTNPFVGNAHRNHFATLRFSKNADGRTVDLSVDYWPVLKATGISEAGTMKPACTSGFRLF